MMILLAQILTTAACGLLLILAIAVVGEMHRTGNWGAFALWLGVALGALVGAAQRQVPLPVALLLLIVVVMIWRRRHKIARSVRHGGKW